MYFVNPAVPSNYFNHSRQLNNVLNQAGLKNHSHIIVNMVTIEEQIAQISDSLEKLPRILRNNLDKNLCTCNEVLKVDIIHAILNGASTVNDVKKQTYATMGSGCCTQQVERLIECLCSLKKEN